MRDFKKQLHVDLTREATTFASVGSRIEPMVKNADKYNNLQEMKNDFIKMIDDDKTSISKAKILEYKNCLGKIYSLNHMQRFITDVYCASTGYLSMSQLKRGRYV
jgi:hypothetical protein